MADFFYPEGCGAAQLRRAVTPATWATLGRALDLERRFDAGIFPRGGSQHQHFRRLAASGLLVEDGFGFDIDGCLEREVLIYRLTAPGRRLAERLEAEEA